MRKKTFLEGKKPLLAVVLHSSAVALSQQERSCGEKVSEHEAIFFGHHHRVTGLSGLCIDTHRWLSEHTVMKIKGSFPSALYYGVHCYVAKGALPPQEKEKTPACPSE